MILPAVRVRAKSKINFRGKLALGMSNQGDHMKSRLVVGLLLAALWQPRVVPAAAHQRPVRPRLGPVQPRPARPRTSRSPRPTARYPFPLTASCPRTGPVGSRSPQGPRLLARALWVVRVRRRSSPRTPPPSRPRTRSRSIRTTRSSPPRTRNRWVPGALRREAKITAPYTGSVTVVSHSGTTYIVIVLTSSPHSSPSASPTAS